MSSVFSSPMRDKIQAQVKALLRRRDGEESVLTTGQIAGIVALSVFALLLFYVLYRYMIWVPRVKAKKAVEVAAGKTGAATSDSAGGSSSADETRKLLTAAKVKL